MTSRAAVIAGGVLLVASAGAWAALGSRGQSAAEPATTPNVNTPTQQDPLLEARSKGSQGAPLTMIEVGDFECPACRTFFKDTWPALEQEYIASGKLRVIFVNLPLVSLHPNAAAAAQFALCSAQQGRFWPVHDLLYEHQASWSGLSDPSPYFMVLADSAALAAPELSACLESPAMRDLLMGEAQGAYNSGIRSTPSFVLEGVLIPGALPIDFWRPFLDSVYTEKTAR